MNSNNKILLAILWPFGALVSALRNWREPWAMNVFWVVCAFLGAIHIFHPVGTVLGDGADAGRYMLDLQYMYQSVHSYSEISRNFYDGDTNDVFATTLLFLVSRITDSGHVFFFVLAIIYGFFYSRNIWYILDKIRDERINRLWILIALFFFVGPIWFINGVRMFTAMHVFCYGALPYLLDGDKKKLVWPILSFFIHFSFTFVIVIFAAYILIIKKYSRNNIVLTVLLGFYLVTLTIKSLDLSAASSLLHVYLPGFFDARIDGYVNEDTLNKRLDSLSYNSWHVAFFNDIQYWCNQVLVLISFITVKKYKDQLYNILPLFAFALLIYGFANIFACVPSGGRYIVIAKMFMIPVFIFIFKYAVGDYSLSRYMKPIIVFLAFSLIFEIRKGLENYGVGLMGNFFTAYLFDDRTPIIYLIKFL